MKRDFAQLYASLGLQPECSLDELKHAYRRRVGQLHPDRPQAERTPEAQAQLRELIRLYTTALRFHRRHGRLPGLAAPAVFRADWPPRPRHAARTPAAPPAPATTQQRTTVVLVLVLVSLFAWAAYAPKDESTKADAASAEPATPLMSGPLALGDDAATVAAIQGHPTQVTGSRWYYGPSWVEFSNGRLSDWNSSTLRPLDTESATPAR